MKAKLLISCFIPVLLASCAVNSGRTLLSQQNKEQARSVESYHLVLQDEVRPAIEISNVTGAMAGGLIPALIDSSINKSRSKEAQDINEVLFNAIDDLDLRSLIAPQLNRSVGTVFQLKNPKSSAESVLMSDKEIANKIKTLEENDYFLFTSSFYAMQENSKSFSLTTHVGIFKNIKDGKSSGLPKPIYENNFGYISAVHGTGGADSIGFWAANNGVEFKNSMKEAVAEIANMLKYDLQNTLSMECNKTASAEILNVFGGRAPVNVIVIEQKNDRAMVRDANSGALYSVQGTPAPKSFNIKDCK